MNKIIVSVITELNELGKKCIVSDKPFCKYNSLIYFEQSNFFFEKYFPKISETEEKTEIDIIDEDSVKKWKMKEKMLAYYHKKKWKFSEKKVNHVLNI